jgi:hypothetical protein
MTNYYSITNNLENLQPIKKSFFNVFGSSSKKEKEENFKSFVLSVIRINYHSCMRDINNKSYETLCDKDKKNIYKLGKKIKIGNYYIIDIFEEITVKGKYDITKIFFLIKEPNKVNLFLDEINKLTDDTSEIKEIKKYTIYKNSEIYSIEKEKGKSILEVLNKEQKNIISRKQNKKYTNLLKYKNYNPFTTRRNSSSITNKSSRKSSSKKSSGTRKSERKSNSSNFSLGSSGLGSS